MKINAGLAKGRVLTGSPSIRIDLENAGAKYQDVPVVAGLLHHFINCYLVLTLFSTSFRTR